MKILTEYESEKLLKKEKLPVSNNELIKNQSQLLTLKLKYPLAVKVSSKKIIHKSDVGGVILNIKNKEELIKAFKKIKTIKHFEAALIQEYKKGYYLLIGLKKDPVFGHVIAVGAGGIYTEIIKDVSFRVCPINIKDANEMLKELKIYKILTGVRGKKPMDIEKIKHLLLKISRLPKKYPKIKELDINPLIVNQKESIIVDARIILDS